MISIVQQPGAIALSRNPMVIEFLATDDDNQPYTPKGVRSELKILSINGLEEDDTITLNWTEPDGTTGNITFTAKDSPSLSTEFISDDTIGKPPSPIGYWRAVAETINGHPTVNRHFKVYAIQYDIFPSPDYSLFVEVVEVDSDWVLTMTSSTALTITNYDTALATTAPDNYSILVDVFFEEEYGTGEYSRISKHELPLNSTGTACLDLSEVIWQKVKGSLPQVPLNSIHGTDIVIADNLRNYYYRYREDYDDVSPAWTVSVTKKAMAGGITQDLFATTNFLGTRSAINSLLTWYPSGKSVAPDQPEWINWFNFNVSSKSIAIELKVWTALSDTPTISYKHTLVDPVVDMWEVANIPVGPTQLVIGDTIKKYSVQVIDRNDYNSSGTITPLSEVRIFYIDRLPQQEVRYILYENGFCLPEVLRCTGISNNQLNVQREERTHVLPKDYTELSPEISQYKEEYSNAHTFRTGYIGRNEVDALQELLIYNRAFEVENTTYIPLHIQGNRYQVSNTNEFLNGVQFVAIRQLSDKIYRRRERPGGYVEIPEPAAAVFTCDYTLSGTYASFAAAIADGITAGEYFDLDFPNDFGLPEGLHFQYAPAISYANDAAAAIVDADSCYPISSGNSFGYPQGMVKRKSPATSYFDDAAAGLAGVAIGEKYALAYPNLYELGDEGFVKTRIT
ncbi:hypothetical protein [Flavilitoribacter nigricans]|uniref:Uncharacterized protein n=1 Tax=Flavilitoribacter nigricans (strain ATCC 23147 / DSM 23189 / NBRC 102662 / NCIMB 1420 / SS-2) TaxID=1122177 RepID=A0A2D0NEP3_FLAN2|nr:hypothetical protein [Flavilitoribacter nigricans]PHN06947.1 hypothetical protein CRP01_09025 [Flavilitoribacter nigricans DSM 23189 = NBRC 102662]